MTSLSVILAQAAEPVESRTTTILADHERGATCVAVSHDGRLLVAGDGRGHVHLWDIAAARRLHRFDALDSFVSQVAFSQDDKLLAAGSAYGDVRIWGLQKRELLSRLKVSGSDLSFLRDRKTLAVASAKGIKFWDLESKSFRLTDTIDVARPIHLAYSPQERFMAVSKSHDIIGANPPIVIWEVAARKWLAREIVSEMFGESLAFSSDGKKLASAASTEDRAFVDVWNTVNWRKTVSYRISDGGEVHCLAISPNSRYLAAAGIFRDKAFGDEAALFDVHLIELETGRIVEKLIGHEDVVSGLAFFPNGQLLASASGDSTVRLWKVHSPIGGQK